MSASAHSEPYSPNFQPTASHRSVSSTTPSVQSPYQNEKLLDFWNLVISEEPATWESLFVNVAVYLEIDLTDLDTTTLRKRLDPAISLPTPTLSKLSLALKNNDPEAYFRKFIINAGGKDAADSGKDSSGKYSPKVAAGKEVGKKGESALEGKPFISSKRIPNRNSLLNEKGSSFKLTSASKSADPLPAKPTIPPSPAKFRQSPVMKNEPAVLQRTPTEETPRPVEKSPVPALGSKPPPNAEDSSEFKAYSKYDLDIMERTKAEAESGNVAKMCKLASLYMSGIHTVKDYSLAYKWYSKAAELKDPEALNSLAMFYLKGNAVEKDIYQAAMLYTKAAEEGSISGMYNLAMCFRDGIGYDKDDMKAFYWFQKSSALGNSAATNRLGMCYQLGTGVKQDHEKAFSLYLASADKNYAKSYWNLGYCCENGIGTEQDIIRAFEYYRRAAEKGNAKGQHRLGEMYEKGIGTPMNKALAKEWKSRALEQGFEDEKQCLIQ